MPFPRGRGTCPTCGGPVIAKCGPCKIHHWAHQSAEDCDSWSEGIGPWHISWQDLVRPEFVEVSLGEHRADILGNSGTVIELQHSTIGPRTIEQREQFYGNMVWVFDATHRFAAIRSGARGFFALGRVRHVTKCEKPVFLDFGGFLVQIEAFSNVLEPFSGFGLIRDRNWFVAEYLSERRNPAPIPSAPKRDGPASDVWQRQQSWKLTTHPSQWLESSVGRKVTIPKDTIYFPLNHSRVDHRNRVRPIWAEIIDQHPGIAQGWTEAELHQMKTFLGGTPMILGGFLRLMPAPATEIAVQEHVNTVGQLLQKANAHIGAGRLPLLKEETRRLLLDKAEAFGQSSTSATGQEVISVASLRQEG
jgi:hypothetical protein